MALIPWPAIVAVVVASLVQTPPVPKPFPQPGQPTTQAPPAKTEPAKPDPKAAPPAGAAQKPAAIAQSPAAAPAVGIPTEATLGAPLYPTSEFLESFDAGRGQRYYLFGTNAAFTEIVAYYKNVLKNGGRAIFEAPPMQQWDLGKFQEQTMAFPPSVVVKDYAWSGATGYLHVEGQRERRFKTIIQIVPAVAPIK